MSARERESGEGPGVLLEGNKEGSRRRGFEGDRGGGGIVVVWVGRRIVM